MGIQIVGLACLFRFAFFRLPKTEGMKFPGVSVIKSCHTAVDHEEENFIQFFEQEYPGPYQLIFTVSNRTDTVVPVIEKVMAMYPKVDSKLVISTRHESFLKKVDALHDAHDHVKHPFVIWSDSDTWVEKNYVQLMSASLQEPGVSVVTTPQYDWKVNTVVGAWKSLANNADMATSIMLMDTFTKDKRVAWGQSIGFNNEEFKSFGDKPWKLINHFMADDQALAISFSDQGKKVVFKNIYCPVWFTDKKLANVFEQKIRWLPLQRIPFGGNRLIYLVMVPLGYPLIIAFIYALLRGFTPDAWALMGATVIQRLCASLIFEMLIVRSATVFLKYFWTIPLWDLSQIYFIIHGFFKTTSTYHGKRFKVVNKYFFEEISS